MTPDGITPEAIVEVLEERLFVEVDGPDHDLIEAGELDSLRFVELLLAAEEIAGQPISPKHLDLDDMRTPRSIAKALGAALEGSS